MAGTGRKYRFKGHESFVLREGWLNKGMAAVSRDSKIFSKNSGADELGVGVNMAKAIRYWMKCADLIHEEKIGITLNEKGALIYQKDTYLEDIFSLWIIHCNIAMNQKEATVWNLFFNQFDADEFDSDYLKQEMLRLVANLPGIEKYAERSVLDDCDALLRMYSRQKEENKTPEEKNVSPFYNLGLLRNSNGIYFKEQPLLTKMPEEIIWYIMGHKQLDAFSMDELLEDENSPGKLLNLKRNGLMELLEKLSAKNIVEINRTAGLDMVYMKKSEEQKKIMEIYYEK